MLPGELAGSPNDRPFLIGSHYDTVRTTSHGTDDNGSGVTAMLQVAKQISTGEVMCSFPFIFPSFDSSSFLFPEKLARLEGPGYLLVSAFYKVFPKN